VNKGVLIEDARDFSVVGCSAVQLTRKDKGGHNAGYMNMASCLEFALRDGFYYKGNRQLSIHTGDARQFKTFEEVVEAFKKHIEHLIGIYTKAVLKAEIAQRDQCPTPFISSFIQDCITRARDRNAGGAVYNFGPSARCVGFATVVDSLAILKKLVFEDKTATMDEFIKAMDADFEGYEYLMDLSKDVPRYGNDDDYVDSIAHEVTKIYAEAQNKHKSLYGGGFHPGFSSVSSNVSYGTVVATLPDGRHKYTPLSDGVSPNHGVEKNGPTAVVLSSTKLFYEGLSGGSILNIRLSPSTVKGPEGLENLVSFVKGMQKAGIWHAQFNINDAEMLKDAQLHPEKYPDMVVRITGFSVYFCTLSKDFRKLVVDRVIQN
jgi:formate C-acetyltransferase